MSGRYAIVGNSFVGAIMKALQADPALARGHALDFAASAGGAFADIAVADGRLANTRQSEQFKVGPVADYDALFVYGLFPSPHLVDKQYRRLARGRYSAQVTAAAVTDFLAASEAYVVHRRIREATRAPVYILSANTPSYLGGIAAEDHARAVSAIRAAVGEEYIETPRAMYTDDLAPDRELYRGSVNINGLQLGERQELHDYNHLNERGGAIILGAMMDRIDASTARAKARRSELRLVR